MEGEVRQASYTRVRKQGWPLVYSKEILYALLRASVDSFEDKIHPYNNLSGGVKVLMSVTM